MTAVASIVVSVLSLLGFLLFARSLAGAIRKVTDTMGRLASGDVSVNVEGQGRLDEIGAMAGAVEVFRQNAIERIRLEEETEANRGFSGRERIEREQEKARQGEAVRLPDVF